VLRHDNAVLRRAHRPGAVRADRLGLVHRLGAAYTAEALGRSLPRRYDRNPLGLAGSRRPVARCSRPAGRA
jgi:hypothetical protein